MGRRSSTAGEKVTLRPAGDDRLDGAPARRRAGTGVVSRLSPWVRLGVRSWAERRGDLCRTVTRTWQTVTGDVS